MFGAYRLLRTASRHQDRKDVGAYRRWAVEKAVDRYQLLAFDRRVQSLGVHIHLQTQPPPPSVGGNVDRASPSARTLMPASNAQAILLPVQLT